MSVQNINPHRIQPGFAKYLADTVQGEESALQVTHSGKAAWED